MNAMPGRCCMKVAKRASLNSKLPRRAGAPRTARSGCRSDSSPSTARHLRLDLPAEKGQHRENLLADHDRKYQTAVYALRAPKTPQGNSEVTATSSIHDGSLVAQTHPASPPSASSLPGSASGGSSFGSP